MLVDYSLSRRRAAISTAANTPPPPPNNNNSPVRSHASDKASAVRSMGGFAVQGDSSDEEYNVPAAEAQICLPCIERLVRTGTAYCERGGGNSCTTCASARRRTTPADVVPATPLTPAGGTARSAAAAALPSTPGDPMGALVLASQALTPSRSGGV
ncbi:hypothetical protein DCS_00793 [Drechmeria coniospora]|uniref:Uncharacterized protein n=1 Tax=Drechmeria coniospora TaxID=98403 RepID=A0A151GRC9_DRECN|nr:hypothetical protein DCS_00793 [Drechmeria coniospora]KYK59659.1 hypothetical protein DCS_00793 [Drechmeria coniospora]